MAEVFISYSRHDGAFVRRLHDALVAAGREVWVDFEGIPPSAEWMNEIHAAIEAAETVIFVITPQSAASKVCIEELSYALTFNKRMIPVLLEDVDPALLLKPICDRNWIFCRERDDFDAAVASVISAIDTDLDWLRAHTRLLTRAVEWNDNRRDKSFALRGSDLHSAEKCLTMADKEPRLSALQIEYILGSRRDEHARRNRMIGVSGVTAAVLMVIATLLVFKYNESLHNLARDFREKAMASLAGSDPVRAELYAARALTLDGSPDARQILLPFLLQARAKSARLVSVVPGRPGGAVIAATADGAIFAMKAKGTVSLWDVKAGREIAALPYGGEKVIAAFSRDGRLVAVAAEHSLTVRPMADDATSFVFGDAAGITSLAFDPGGRLLASGANDGTISLWDVQTGNPQPVFAIRKHRHQVSSIAFSPDGRFLASGSWDNNVKLWRVTTNGAATSLDEIRTLEGHDDAVLSLAFSPDGTVLASGGWDNRILLWDRDRGQQLREFLGHNGGVLSLAFDARGDWLASGSEDSTARIWQVEAGRPLLLLPGAEGNVTTVAFAGPQAPHKIALGDQTGAIHTWDLDTIGQRDELLTLYGHKRPVKALAFNPKRAQLASGSWDRTVRLWDLETKTARVLRSDDDRGPTDSVTAVNFNADGDRLVVASKDGSVRLWDIDTPAVRILKPPGESEPSIVRDVSFSPDKSLIATGNDDGHIRIWSAVDGSFVNDFTVDPGAKSPKSVLTVAFSPDGKLLATSGEDTIVRLWSVPDWSLAGTLAGHTDEVWQLAFSPDGALLFSASDDRTVRIWDMASQRQAGAPLDHAGPVWGVDIAGDGHLLATASSDGTVHLWTLNGAGAAITATPGIVMRFSEDPVWVIALNRDRENPLVAIGGVDRAIRIVRVNRLKTLFDDSQKLEQEAERGSGLEISKTPDYALGPYRPGAR